MNQFNLNVGLAKTGVSNTIYIFLLYNVFDLFIIIKKRKENDTKEITEQCTRLL